MLAVVRSVRSLPRGVVFARLWGTTGAVSLAWASLPAWRVVLGHWLAVADAGLHLATV
jgi:hypothetical protein